MSENESAAQRRQQEEREARTAEMRRLLDQPHGSEEVAKKFGKSALASDEYKAAQRQRQAAQARRRDAAESRARDARQSTDVAGQPRTRQEMVAAQKQFAQSGTKTSERSRDRLRSQAQSM